MAKLGSRGRLVVIGAGQAGSLLSLYLAHQGHEVELYESRPDLRRHDISAGRSINLALATRGLVALEQVGLADDVDSITVPMAGRMIHTEDGELFQPYGIHDSETINSVSRTDLNAILLDAAEATGRVTTHFGYRAREVDFDTNTIRFDVDPAAGSNRSGRSDGSVGSGSTEPQSETIDFGTVFGCDGSNSKIRKHLIAANGGSVAIDRLEHGYKELTIPPVDGGGFALDPNALHIWPRGQFMLIALPNPTGDFTVTLFMRLDGVADSFVHMHDNATVERFFNQNFGGFADLVPDLAGQFFANPVGHLATVRTSGWSLDDRAVLVGDSAHAIVPFHGQGMNLALGSCRMLDKALTETPDDPAGAFARFEADRKPDADAIADMALENYIEMRSDVVDPNYQLRRALALELSRRYPDRITHRYGMVMFTTLSYAEARRRAAEQSKVFDLLMAGATSLDDIDFDRAAGLVEALGPLPPWK